MNKRILILIVGLIVIVGGVLVYNRGAEAPANTPKATSTATSTQAQLDGTIPVGNYEIVSASSSVVWAGSKPLLDAYEDTGTFPVSGSIDVSAEGIESATTTFDIADLSVTDVSAGGETAESKLAEHLRSEDFLHAEQYPTSTLVINSVSSTSTEPTSYNVSAGLTIKGQAHTIDFPAEIGMDGDTLVVRANTAIDRSRWNIRYGSPSFFNDLGDDLIADMVDISVDLRAVQK